MVVLPWHNLVMVELLIFLLLSFRNSSIFFVPAQLWRHDRSTECPLEGKHWAACSCTNMILMFLLSAAALHGPHTALPGGSAVAQLGDGRVAHFPSFELSKLIHLLCASPIVAPRSLYRVPTGRKTLGSLQLHKHANHLSHIWEVIWMPLALVAPKSAGDWVKPKVNSTNWRECGGILPCTPNKRSVSSKLVSCQSCCIACTQCG